MNRITYFGFQQHENAFDQGVYTMYDVSFSKKGYSMNKEQKKALAAILEPNMSPLLITGHGGTGKTYTAVKAITEAVKIGKRVIVLCPTHQAKEQFYLGLPTKIQEKITIKTTASFLLQYPNKLPTGEMYFRRGGRMSAGCDLLFVDESSMLGEVDMQCLASLEDCKTIFLADFEQLRPVMKKQGSFWQSLETIELVEQHRNAGLILKLASHARKEIIYPAQTSDCNSLVVVDDEEMLYKNFLKTIKHSPEPYNIAYLAYRNAVVNKRSKDTHIALYGERPFVKHQYVRLGQSCKAGNNGSIVIIEKTRKVPTDINGKMFDLYRCSIRNITSGLRDVVNLMDIDTQNEVELIKERIIMESHIAYNRKDFDHLEYLQDKLKKIEKLTCVSSSPFVQTIHKSQGRTINKVFVNTLDVHKGRDRKRLLYVSYSRAKLQLSTIRINSPKAKLFPF